VADRTAVTPAPPSLDRLAALLRAVAHPARLRLLALLAWYEIHPPRPLDRRGRKGLSPAYWWLAGPACLSPSALSKHLHELRWAGLVAAARGEAGGPAGPPYRLAAGALVGATWPAPRCSTSAGRG
jgi:DNA-binding transcriptional ArsR family regulator